MTYIKNNLGITTVQSLVIAGAFGLVVALAMWGVSVSRGSARDAMRVSDVKQIQAGLELYYQNHGAYPQVSEGAVLALGGANARCLDETGFHAVCSGKLYMDFVPQAPQPADKDCSAEANSYRYVGNGAEYAVAFCLGRAVGSLPAGNHQASFGKIE